MQDDWLREMMRLSGVETEQEEEYYPPMPGMLPLEEEEADDGVDWESLRVAEDQTLALIEEQEALRGTHSGAEGEPPKFTRNEH